MIPILLIVAILIFTMMQFVPGDPVQIMLGDSATPMQIEEVREEMGLNDPFIVKLFNFLKDLQHQEQMKLQKISKANSKTFRG